MNCQSATVNKACSCAVGSTSSIIGCVVCLCGRSYLPQRKRSTVKCARPGSPSQGHDAVKRAKESLPSLWCSEMCLAEEQSLYLQSIHHLGQSCSLWMQCTGCTCSHNMSTVKLYTASRKNSETYSRSLDAHTETATLLCSLSHWQLLNPLSLSC